MKLEFKANALTLTVHPNPNWQMQNTVRTWVGYSITITINYVHVHIPYYVPILVRSSKNKLLIQVSIMRWWKSIYLWLGHSYHYRFLDGSDYPLSDNLFISQQNFIIQEITQDQGITTIVHPLPYVSLGSHRCIDVLQNLVWVYLEVSYLVHVVVQLDWTHHDLLSLSQVGLKLVVPCLQLGDLPLDGVSRKVLCTRHLVSHATKLGQVVELML